MSDLDLISIIKAFGYSAKTIDMQLKLHNAELYDELRRRTSFLPDESAVSERIYCLTNNIKKRPVCPICRIGFLKFNRQALSYRKTCSISCTNKDPAHKHAVSEKLGIMMDAIKQKRKTTNLKRYGASAPAGSPNVVAKMMATKLDRYGESTYNNRKKAAATCLARYGVDNNFKSSAVRTMSSAALTKRSFDEFVADPSFQTQPMFSYEEYACRRTDRQEFDFKCLICGKVFKSPHYDGRHRRCPTCHPEDWTGTAESSGEIELRTFIESVSKHCLEFKNRSVIGPKELDIYIPDLNLAFEYDGLFYHSSSMKSKKYHLDKTDACARLGIKLIHVFEDEWLSKREIVESRIKNCLGIFTRTIYARNCQIKSISQKIAGSFCDENHLQGKCGSSLCLGMFNAGELISVMTFGKCRFDKIHEWELMRYCVKSGCHLVGGAGKMLKFFERNFHPKSLVTYADRRWSDGNLYRKLGFDFLRVSAPNYWYFKNNSVRYSRLCFQKHKLRRKLENFDPAKTERQNMIDNGYHLIYDCGNYVFEKNYETTSND